MIRDDAPGRMKCGWSLSLMLYFPGSRDAARDARSMIGGYGLLHR